jgi:SAM-dependent methyltransferase
VNPLERDLARYYDQDAPRRAARTLDPERVRRRGRFTDLLRREARTRVLEVGVGTGTDAAAMQADGLTVTGVDLSAEHVAISRAAGIEARVASLLDLPFVTSGFEAVWSMSVLMHVPDRDMGTALSELGRVLLPGAPAALGLWGGDDHEGELEDDEIEPHRYFNWRSNDHLKALLEEHAEIEEFETWWVGDPPHLYQWCVIRFP